MTDTPAIIRADRIQILDGVTVDGEDFTAVCVIGKEGSFAVRETPEQIMEMIEKCSSR